MNSNERLMFLYTNYFIVFCIMFHPAFFCAFSDHYYVIGECGGAMERSTCPECGLSIGGESHALDSTNSHAGEMDGSSYPAWSDQANMANYQFDF